MKKMMTGLYAICLTLSLAAGNVQYITGGNLLKNGTERMHSVRQSRMHRTLLPGVRRSHAKGALRFNYASLPPTTALHNP